MSPCDAMPLGDVNIRTASTLHISCTTDIHLSKSMQMKTYDPKALFTSVWSIFRHINRSRIPETWDPSVKNITLSVNRFRDGIDGRSKQITEWVMKAVDKNINNAATPNEMMSETSSQTLTNVHHSQRHVEKQDDDIQIIADVRKEARTTTAAVRPKTTVKKRRKKVQEKSTPPMKKISDFFKKQ
ncbi:unnamed protein product [Litomosoides sigmodontis]|uniref:Uncharacterized protein n=1 Tax=Litomosoides sigmodontis TaxID=42156 RepID=A0A3P6UGY0_LITSI|nr:unnamed protein product [Litomosoides sigmodontis]